ncbi:uncharacterized protein DUF1080 [Frondihabitans sp. PhB188]|uniref:family 16 glycoside hydrolase n=1 Tax=Frondihabitans sp. PhB188 TaxID=2485200 RepID=UPI000FC23D35|nr:family 16 glycoside hydrolase [Frondihabitans sp. PhB188]ROQ38213.1 uncharacterized protein DUF1080 [Frondihabitans sp. PhB188]
MSVQETASDRTNQPADATGQAPAPHRARTWVSAQLRRRRVVAGVGVLLLAAVALTAELAPGTSSGFTATVGTTSNTVGTAPNFSPSGGVLPYNDTWDGGDSGWNDYSGTWATASATSGSTYTESSSAANGPKAVTGQTSWTDYTLQGDVKINSGSQAGLLFRVQGPGVGNDTLNGYYLGLYTSGSMTLGRENNSYTALKSTAGTVAAGTWYHVTIQAVGCVFTYTMQPLGQLLGTGPVTSATYTDAGCPTAGAIGVREFGSGASWRNITATSGGTTSTAIAPYLSQFGATTAATSGWSTYGGTWSTNTGNETYANSSSTAGAKALTGTSTWGNYSLTGDVLMTSAPTATTGAGFLVRASGASSGLNNVAGYYVNLSSTNLSITRIASGTATVLDTDPLPATLGASTWYHVTVEAVGCTISATAQLKTGSVLTRSTAADTGCAATSGLVGLRTLGTPATWRAIAVTPR